MSTQRAGAELLADLGVASCTQTPVATGQSDCGLASHAHHTAFTYDRKRERDLNHKSDKSSAQTR